MATGLAVDGLQSLSKFSKMKRYSTSLGAARKDASKLNVMWLLLYGSIRLFGNPVNESGSIFLFFQSVLLNNSATLEIRKTGNEVDGNEALTGNFMAPLAVANQMLPDMSSCIEFVSPPLYPLL